ncbi:MAG: O-antigen ligase family protein [Bacteroidota bacterium]|nr:O-antigen ligase family protein [Bacteroidota bacterium]
MNKTTTRFNETLPAAILLFSSLAVALSFVFPASFFIGFSSCLAIAPVLAYLLFFKRAVFYPLLVFLVPLSISIFIGDGTKADLPSEPLLGLMMLMVVVGMIVRPTVSKEFLQHPVSILIMIELCWMIFCSLNGELPLVSLKRCIVRFGFVTVFYILFSQWMTKPLSAGKVFILYAAGCVIPIIHGIIFHAKFNFSSIAAYLMPRPFFAEHTIYGACLAFILPMLVILIYNSNIFRIRGLKLLLLSALTLLIIAGEFLSFSRAAWVSLGVAFVFRILIFFRIRLWMIFVVLSLAGIFAYQNSGIILEKIKRNESVSNKGGISDHLMSVANVQSDASNLERINRWKCALRMTKERPVTGFGPGTYQFIYGSFQSRADLTRISTFRGTNGHAHSEFFNAISETGIPGGLIYLALLFLVIGYGLRVIYNSKEKQEKAIALGALLGLVTFFVHGFFNAFLDTDKIAVLVFGSIAIIVCLDIRQRKSPVTIEPVFEKSGA